MSQLLDQADNLQQKTKESLGKINSNINDINNIADLTLCELRANSEQIDSAIKETTSIDKKLNLSEKLKNKFSMLNGNFFNFNIFKSNLKSANKSKLANLTNPTNSENPTNPTKMTTSQSLSNNINSNNQFIKFANVQVGQDNLADRLNKINQNDYEINNSLDSIASSLDIIMEKSKLMKEEVVQQSNKLDELDSNMIYVVSKQDKISTDLKNILRKKS
jgi:hypothetical protein